MAASEFARFVLNSSILELLEANPSPEPLAVDGSLLRWKCGELLRECNERFQKNSMAPSLSEASLLSLHEKLDMVAGYVSKLSMPVAVSGLPIATRLEAERAPSERTVNGNERDGWTLAVLECGQQTAGKPNETWLHTGANVKRAGRSQVFRFETTSDGVSYYLKRTTDNRNLEDPMFGVLRRHALQVLPPSRCGEANP